MIYKVIKKILNFFSSKPTGRSFFEFSSSEKKKIIERAAEESSKMQKDLLDRYEKKYGSDDKFISTSSTVSFS